MNSDFRERWHEFREEMRRMFSSLAEAHLFRTFGILLTLMVVGAFVVWLIEGQDTFPTPFDALWWAVVTITTVGYGDISPQYFPGKLATILIILTGVALVSMFTATISSVFVASKIREGKGLQEIFYRNHIIIAGWHPGAEKLLEALWVFSRGKIRLVLVNELESAAIESLLVRFKEMKPKFVRGNFNSETILKRAGVNRAEAMIILPDMHDAAMATAAQVDQKTILATLTIKDINSRIKVYAHALEPESIPHMRRGGVDRVVLRDAYAGFLLACHAMAPGVPEVVDELLSLDRGHKVDRVFIPRHLVGRKVADVREWVAKELNGTLLGLVVEEKVIEMEDILSDDLSSIDAFIKRKFEEAGRSPEELATTRVQINPNPDREVRRNEIAVVILRTGKAA